MEEDEKLISFMGLAITLSDAESVADECFLNDRVIEFYFRYLENIYREDDILFVSPSISHFLANFADRESVQGTSESLKLFEKKLIFFTINNDEPQYGMDGGTHWSLLVYYRLGNAFYYHDSLMSLGNRSQANKLYIAVKDLMNARNHEDVSDDDFEDTQLEMPPPRIMRHHDGRIYLINNLEPRIYGVYTPQQSNCYDCGLYVMKVAEVICDWYQQSPKNEYVDPDEGCQWTHAVNEHVTQFYVECEMRPALIELFHSMVDDFGDID